MTFNNVSTVAVVIIAFSLIFADRLFGSVDSVENTVDSGLCVCVNSTTGENGYKNCKCVSHKLKAIPSDLPTRLHEL